MSRQTKYSLIFPKSNIKVDIRLQKTTDGITGFNQGKDGRKVCMVRALAVDDVRPTSLEDLEELVPYADLESYFSYRDPESGDTKLIKIDKKAIKAMYKNSDSMRVEGVLDSGLIKPHMFTDSHYFVDVQNETKSKTVAPASQKVYTIIYHYLLAMDKYMMVKFISANREKFAVIYADPDSAGLRLSILIHSTYQRTRNVSHLMEITDVLKFGDKLFEKLQLRSLDSDKIIDDYEERIRAYIDECKTTKSTSIKIKVKGDKPKTTEVDVLDMIMGL